MIHLIQTVSAPVPFPVRGRVEGVELLILVTAVQNKRCKSINRKIVPSNKSVNEYYLPVNPEGSERKPFEREQFPDC
jgi:hypothetical protein